MIYIYMKHKEITVQIQIIGIFEEIDSIDQKCASWKSAKKFGKSSPPYLGNELDSIADSLIENNWLSWQIISDDKIQITLLILGRGSLSRKNAFLS